MTKDTLLEMAELIASMRRDIDAVASKSVALEAERNELAAHVSAHVDALKQSNAQCGEYLRRNEQLHSELVDVRAALAATTEQRDSLRRTLDEWERADTKPHNRVTAEDVADHVVPPVLPMCTTCHGCGGPIIYGTVVGSPSVLHCRNEHCLRRVWAWRDDISPYHGPCKSSTPVRHE